MDANDCDINSDCVCASNKGVSDRSFSRIPELVGARPDQSQARIVPSINQDYLPLSKSNELTAYVNDKVSH